MPEAREPAATAPKVPDLVPPDSLPAGASVGIGAAPSQELNRLALMCLLAGACALIPIPFVDDWTLRQVRRRTFGDLLSRAGLANATDEQIRRLAGERVRDQGGCLLSFVLLAVKAVVYFVGKLFKKIVFILTLRDCVRSASQLFAEGYLVQHAIALGAAEQSLAAGEPGASRLRATVDAVLLRAGSGPVRRVVRGVLSGSWGALVRASRVLRRGLSRRRSDGDAAAAIPLAEEESLLSALAERLATALWMEAEYRQRLEALFASLYYHSHSANRRRTDRLGAGSGA